MKILPFLLAGIFVAVLVQSVYAADVGISVLQASQQDPKTAELKPIVDGYNKFFGQVPDFVKSVVGTEIIRAELTFKDGAKRTAGFKTKKGLITDYQNEPYPDSTMALYFSEETIEKIMASENPISALKEAWGKEIRFEGISLLSKIKVFFMNIGFSIFALFMGG